MKSKTMNADVIVFAIVMSGLISSSQSATPTFRENAADFIKAGFKKTTHRGVEKEDYSKIEIEASPLLMVQEESLIDENHVKVEIKSGDGDWKVMNSTPSMRGGVYKWTAYNIEPCENHDVGIWVQGMDENKISFKYPHTILAASLDDLATSGYRPHMPEDVQIGEYSEGHIEVSWTPAKCASMYDVTSQKLTGGKTIRKQVIASHGNSISLTDEFDSCSEYEIRVSAVVGDEYSEENIVTFSTPPETDSAARLDPIAQPFLYLVNAKWKGFEKLSCVSEYIISICKEGEECEQGQQIERDDSLQFMEFQSDNNLEECSDYTLNIKPVHNEVDMKEKVIQFRTRSHPIDNVTKLLTPVNAEAGHEELITLSWKAIQCANHYQVFQKIEDGEWERIGTTKENFFKQKGVPCTEYKFGVKTTIDDQESEMVLFDQTITLPPTISYSEHPTLVIEEKTNGSLTFVINNNDKNHRCKVEQYHVKYSTEEDYIDPLTLEDGNITIIVPQENIEILGRIKFQGFDSWSPWISSDSPLKKKQTKYAISFLLPIIIGSVVALALVFLMTVYVFRKRKCQMKYDYEKAEGSYDETKKLNDQMVVKITKHTEVFQELKSRHLKL